MPAKRIVIVTPAPPGSRSGNRNTATRWSRILRALDYEVAISTRWDEAPLDCLVALHARKSADSLKRYVRRFPGRPSVLALTGTDLYRDIRTDESAKDALNLASRLIVLQERGPDELGQALRAKTRVIYQSETVRALWQPPVKAFRVCVLGHLREEKDPFRTARALRFLPEAKIEVIHAGKALSEVMAAEARDLMETDARYRWVGELPHWRALRLLARSHALVVSSHMEGGAHVVSEAIAAGVPVIGSAIPGNEGMLGADYPGYFPVEDEQALASLLRRALVEPGWLEGLADRVRKRQPLIAPERERRAWLSLMEELGLRP